MTSAWRLEIRHTTGYRYETDVTASHNEVRLSPIRTERQWVLEHRVDVHPSARLSRFEDYWGTVVHAFDLRRPHRELTVVATSHVETAAVSPPVPDTVPWRVLEHEECLDEWCELLMPTPYTAADGAIDALGEQVRRAPDPAAAVSLAQELIRDRLEYARGATHVGTPAAEALAAGAGVCQDFVHLTLAVLRVAGIPCRYASGYISPEASASIGTTVAGESHAWLEAWTGGWCAVDPTNGLPVGPEHVLVARARLRRRPSAARRVPRWPGRGARRPGRGHPPRLSRSGARSDSAVAVRAGAGAPTEAGCCGGRGRPFGSHCGGSAVVVRPPAANDDTTLAVRQAEALGPHRRGRPRARRRRPGARPVVSYMTHQPAPGESHPMMTGLRAGVIDPREREQVLCDATIVTVITDHQGGIREAGRATSVWSRAQRRAITHRSPHCQWPGCEVPADWCDVQHVQHWAHGGPTTIENGEHLCRRHHSFVHNHPDWTYTFDRQQFRVFRPDGTEVRPDAWPELGRAV